MNAPASTHETPRELAPAGTCPSCAYELDSWEVDLLQHLACPCCGCRPEPTAHTNSAHA